MENDVIKEEITTPLNNTKNIVYNRPTLLSRVIANVLDILILCFTFVIVIWGAREIVSNTSTYKEADNTIVTMKIDSGLYGRDSNNLIKESIVLLDNDDGQNAQSRMYYSKSIIKKFFNYYKTKVDEEKYNVAVKAFDEKRLADTMTYEGTKMFFNIGQEVVENEELLNQASGNGSPIYKAYYEQCYKPFISENCINYFIAIPEYYNAFKLEYNLFLFAELLPSFIVALLITYVLPGFIFSRGKSTFGKRLYKIAYLDSRCLSPTIGRHILRCSLILIEWVLALPSFGITFIISFTMMMLTKNKQSFPDYVTNLIEVKIDNNKIYNDFVEADLDNAETHKQPIDFKM